jgi:flagellin-like hook-associated protein FlgL
LASGQRINSAVDDAAALALADSLKMHSRILGKGVQNLANGTSLLTVAEAAVNELVNITTRIAELAQSAASTTLTHAQRSSLDEEAQALKDDYLRIIQTTELNGQNILSSSEGYLQLQVEDGAYGAIQGTFGGVVGTGNFTIVGSYAEGLGQRGEVVTGDFNRDGNMDMVVVDGPPTPIDNFTVYLGNGAGAFSAGVTYSTGIQNTGVTTADFNEDGILDIAASTYGDDRVNIQLGNGDGTFTPFVTIAAGYQPRFVTASDFNNDGTIDLAVINLRTAIDPTPGSVTILMGNGDGTFDTGVTYEIGKQGRTVRSADLNNDGAQDLVVAGEGEAVVRVLMGAGNGTFSAAVSYSTASFTRDTQVADLNGDGILDLAVTAPTVAAIGIHLGRGDGTFSGYTTLATGGETKTLLAGDLNGDGSIDLAAVNYDDSTLRIFSNSGNGTFSPAVTISGIGAGAFSIAGADFNSDGVLDLAISKNTDQDLSVLLGQSTNGTAPLQDFSLKTTAGALQATPILSRKLEALTVQQGVIGAFQSRVNFATNHANAKKEAIVDAESRIRDINVAEEVATVLKSQILQKTEVAMQAQANQQHKLVLKLLN